MPWYWLRPRLLTWTGRPLLLGPVAPGLLARRPRPARRFGRNRAERNLARRRRLAGNQRLRFVLFSLDLRHRFGLWRRSGRVKLSAEIHGEPFFFIRLDAHQSLVLRKIQQLAELLEAIFAPVETGMLLLHPIGQFLVWRTVVDFQAVRFEHVTQQRDSLLGLGPGLFGNCPALHAHHVEIARA